MLLLHASLWGVSRVCHSNFASRLRFYISFQERSLEKAWATVEPTKYLSSWGQELSMSNMLTTIARIQLPEILNKFGCDYTPTRKYGFLIDLSSVRAGPLERPFQFIKICGLGNGIPRYWQTSSLLDKLATIYIGYSSKYNIFTIKVSIQV